MCLIWKPQEMPQFIKHNIMLIVIICDNSNTSREFTIDFFFAHCENERKQHENRIELERRMNG